jgi:hypothetical protein
MMSRFSDSLMALGNCVHDSLEWLTNSIDPSQVAICTIHGNSQHYEGEFAQRYAWPKLQIERLRRHTPSGYKVFAYGHRLMQEHEEFLRGCPEVEFISLKNTQWGTYEHVWPLRNWLARRAMRDYRWIIHLDSDAFPVSDDWLPTTLRKIRYNQPVVAVKRVENGDQHSDRCFLVYSRAGFRRHCFDFSMVGVADAGGAISAYLEERGLDWHAMLRSNKHDYHPLIAGIYDDLIYHHAAGSRLPRFRQNQELWNQKEHFRHEQATHRILMRRLFNQTDDLLAELRGEQKSFDLSDALEAELKND